MYAFCLLISTVAEVKNSWTMKSAII